MFCAENNLKPDKALELAEKDFGIRQDIYAYDTLSWTHYKNGNFQKASGLIEKALQYETQDAKLYYHAGMINLKLRNIAKAEKYLRTAKKINPEFDTGADKNFEELISKIRTQLK